MKNKYTEIMDKIEVTEEMQKRILENLQKDSEESTPKNKVVFFNGWKKYLSVAACLICLLGGYAAFHQVYHGEEQDNGELVNLGSGIVEVSSLAELEEAVAFPIQEVPQLPFKVTEQSYMAFGKDMAEILYEGEGQNACFRKSVGQEDNSGDYNEYAQVNEVRIGAIDVTLKGDAESYTLAIWYADGFSYSVNLSEGLTPIQWATVLSEF